MAGLAAATATQGIVGVVVGVLLGFAGTSLTGYVEHRRSVQAAREAELTRYRERGAETLAGLRRLLDDIFYERMIEAELPSRIPTDEPVPSADELWQTWHEVSAELVALRDCRKTT